MHYIKTGAGLRLVPQSKGKLDIQLEHARQQMMGHGTSIIAATLWLKIVLGKFEHELMMSK